MRSIKSALFSVVFCSLLTGTVAHAASISGTVTDKTTSKPSAGDKVELVDVQAGMSVAASAKTDSGGRYTLNKPGSGPYLVRVIHQGSPYFIAAPDGNTPADIPVYDAAADIPGVSIEADVIELETANGQLSVTERYFVHNTSSPPRTQYNPDHGFEVILPPEAVVDGTAARRPTGLPTSMNLKPGSMKNHFQFDFPIQPDEADKDTLFQVSYHMPYSGKAVFKPQVSLKADNVAVLLPMSVKFEGSGFNPIKQDPGIQTYLAKNVSPGPGLEFSISGTGSMPREQQGAQGGGAQPGMAAGADAGSQDASTPGTGPGGGIGQPIGTPDPLTKYKWWILGGLGLLLACAAGFLLRKPSGSPTSEPAPGQGVIPPPAAGAVSSAPPVSPTGVHSYLHHAPAPVASTAATPVPGSPNAGMLPALKEELFALESDRISGTISAAEYAEQKAALETVLKRALGKK